MKIDWHYHARIVFAFVLASWLGWLLDMKTYDVVIVFILTEVVWMRLQMERAQEKLDDQG